MRNAFIEELTVLAKQHEHIALVVGDLGYSVIEPFADQFPDRFINAGVAEQNMTGLAAGMASEGYHVFTYSIANFPTFRCAEQIRNDVDYHKLPVTVVSVGGGLGYGPLGYSHHAIQDYALMRVMPNMLIASPGDPMEVRSCIRYLVENPQPSYLRLGKAGEPCFHEFPPLVEPGRWVKILQGESDECLLTTGAALSIAMLSAKSQTCGAPSIYSLPLWGMKFKSLQADRVKDFSRIITVEDHLEDGGFGSWLLESVLKNNKQLAGRLNIRALDQGVCGMVGKQRVLESLCGLG